MCVCVCAYGGCRGRAFAPDLQTAAWFCAAGPCKQWQCRRLLGWLRGVTLLQRNKTQLQGRTSDPSTRLHPPTNYSKEEMWCVCVKRGLEGGGDYSIHCCLSLFSANKKEVKLQLQPVMQLKHSASSPSITSHGSEVPENGQTAAE